MVLVSLVAVQSKQSVAEIRCKAGTVNSNRQKSMIYKPSVEGRQRDIRKGENDESWLERPGPTLVDQRCDGAVLAVCESSRNVVSGMACRGRSERAESDAQTYVPK